MGHRHGFSTPMFGTDQNHLHSGDPLFHLAGSASENNSFFHSMDNLQTDGVQYISHQNPAARANEFSSSTQVVHAQPNQFDASSTHNPLHLPAPVEAFLVPENHFHHASSSNCIIENNSYDHSHHAMGNGREQYKRKSPMIPSITERGSTSGYCSAASSSAVCYERQNVNVQHNCWEPFSMPPGYSTPVGGENSLRNVRRRSSFDMDAHMFMPHRVANHPPHPSSSRQPTDHCNPLDHPSQGPTLPLLERHHVQNSHGRTAVAESSSLSHDASQFVIASSVSNSAQPSGYHHDISYSRNLVMSQSFCPTDAQSRGANTSYPQGCNPTNRIGMVSSVLQPAARLEEELHFVATESHTSRRPRAFTSAGWRNRDRSRSRPSANRYRSTSVDAINHDRLTREGMMFVGHSSSDARNQFDQHGELRLDVDNMSYEELLALGERIGSVSTGLSGDQLSKCLKERLYSPVEQMQMEGRCVICLEEYQNMDQMGTLRACGHVYHSGCIKKWLSMKNLCPICKAPALPDEMKEKEKEKMVAC